MTALHTALPELEAELLRQTAELSGAMLDVCQYAIAGGRRVRAALLLGAAQEGSERALRAAAALEMIHAATLLQDDIFDSGSLRRGRPAAHLRFGRPLTILASDWLLIRALELAAELDPAFFRCLARAGAAMAQAEAGEFTSWSLCSIEEARNHAEVTSRGKTAELFGTALCGAAVLRQLSAAHRTRWEGLGVEMGLTYQMVDDCVDLYGAETAAGKTLGHDLASGWLTLPVLLAVQLLGENGIALPLADLQAGRMEAATLSRLQAAIHSRATVALVQQQLARRLAQHRQQGATLGIGLEVLDHWDCGLRAKLASCFPEPPMCYLHNRTYATDGVRPAETVQDHA